ncbi:MAG: hypothetical protein WCP06_08565 [Verrucomicrobiota bacterium]
MRCLIALTLGWGLLANALAAKPPSGFVFPEESFSPNRVYAVLVPDREHGDGKPDQNSVFEVKTGRVLGPIHGPTGTLLGNGGGVSAKWSSDSSLLVWTVSGKWGPLGIAVVEIKGGKITRQTDLLKAIQAGMLAGLKKERPVEYANAREAIRGNGSACPGGFTVDVQCSLPDAKRGVAFTVALTADPKDALTPDLRLEAYAEGAFDPGQPVAFQTFRALGPVQIGTEKKRLERASTECQQAFGQLLQELSGRAREKLLKEQSDWEGRLKQSTPFSFLDNGTRVQRAAAYEKRSAELMRRLKGT